jgi:hypothetical protein
MRCKGGTEEATESMSDPERVSLLASGARSRLAILIRVSKDPDMGAHHAASWDCSCRSHEGLKRAQTLGLAKPSESLRGLGVPAGWSNEHTH